MNNNTLRKIAFGVLAAGSLAGSAMAANNLYADGDLVMFFQTAGGTTDTLYVNLGNATTYRGSNTGVSGTSNLLNIIDLSSQLTAAFGASWQDSTNLHVGLAGALSSTDPKDDPTVTNGDPTRTIYVSKARTGIGTVGVKSSSLAAPTNAGMGTISTNIIAMNIPFDNATTDTTVLQSPTSSSAIDNQNPISLTPVYSQGTAFNAISGGVQQRGATGLFGTTGVFGPVSNVEFALDLYRSQATNSATGQVGSGEAVRTPTYEGTFVLDTSGKVSFITVPEPSTTVLAGLAGAGALLRRRRKA